MDGGGALQNLVGFLRERRGQSGIVYCHKVLCEGQTGVP